MANWDESKHPRDDDGKFGSGSGVTPASELKKKSAEELAKISDLSSIFVDNNHTVHIIEGNTDNIKITTSKDIAIAEKLITEEDE